VLALCALALLVLSATPDNQLLIRSKLGFH